MQRKMGGWEICQYKVKPVFRLTELQTVALVTTNLSVHLLYFCWVYLRKAIQVQRSCRADLLLLTHPPFLSQCSNARSYTSTHLIRRFTKRWATTSPAIQEALPRLSDQLIVHNSRVQLKCDGTRWRTVGEVKGKLANGVGSQYPSLPRNLVYPALLPLMRTSRLPVVDWTEAPADLNGLVRFAERQNLVSARVPSHFKRSLPRFSLNTTESPYFRTPIHSELGGVQWQDDSQMICKQVCVAYPRSYCDTPPTECKSGIRQKLRNASKEMYLQLCQQ